MMDGREELPTLSAGVGQVTPALLDVFDQLIGWDEVHRLVGYCRMQVDRLEKADDFPKRLKLGKGRGGRVMWRRAEISAWIASRPRGPNGGSPR